jgi:hypothetical protein
MTRGVIAKERVVLSDPIRAGPTPLANLPPPPILERTT